jgi:hypothetical protein
LFELESGGCGYRVETYRALLLLTNNIGFMFRGDTSVANHTEGCGKMLFAFFDRIYAFHCGET